MPDLPATELDRAHKVLMRARWAQIDGVVIAPPNEAPAAARKVLRSRSLKGFYIDSSVTSVEPKPGGGTRVAVSVIVATYPDRAMRAIMQGAATAMGGGDTRAQAVDGRVQERPQSAAPGDGERVTHGAANSARLTHLCDTRVDVQRRSEP